MIEIEIAGAGAGKTYGLAEKLLFTTHENPNCNKILFAITFTNKAKIKISETIIELQGFIPKNIQIDTVHSFLLNEIIFPYSKFILNEVYTKAVSIPLSNDEKLKNYKKARLKEKQIIHNEDVYQKAKIIIDKKNSKHSNKKKKEKVDFVISHIKAITDKIFLDEVQDLDEDAFRIFEILGINSIPIYMIGDPKQAIKYPKAYEEFINICNQRNPEITKLLPLNNKSRRIPKELLIHSNRFCPLDQCQTSLSNIRGCAYYISSDYIKLKEFIEQCTKTDCLVYIEEKEGIYHTHKESKLHFPITVEEKLREIIDFVHYDVDLFIDSLLEFLTTNVQTLAPKIVLNNFLKGCRLTIESNEYAELIQSLERVIVSKDGILVSSIDAVKGLESEKCLFILNENTLKYFFSENLETEKYHNKIWKKIYVALTRSSCELIFVLDKDLLPKQDLLLLKTKFEKLGITDYQPIIF